MIANINDNTGIVPPESMNQSCKTIQRRSNDKNTSTFEQVSLCLPLASSLVLVPPDLNNLYAWSLPPFDIIEKSCIYMIKGTKDGYHDLLSRGMILTCISENHRVITMQPK